MRDRERQTGEQKQQQPKNASLCRTHLLPKHYKALPPSPPWLSQLCTRVKNTLWVIFCRTVLCIHLYGIHPAAKWCDLCPVWPILLTLGTKHAGTQLQGELDHTGGEESLLRAHKTGESANTTTKAYLILPALAKTDANCGDIKKNKFQGWDVQSFGCN